MYGQMFLVSMYPQFMKKVDVSVAVTLYKPNIKDSLCNQQLSLNDMLRLNFYASVLFQRNLQKGNKGSKEAVHVHLNSSWNTEIFKSNIKMLHKLIFWQRINQFFTRSKRYFLLFCTKLQNNETYAETMDKSEVIIQKGVLHFYAIAYLLRLWQTVIIKFY